jgi:hypothetical protein
VKVDGTRYVFLDDDQTGPDPDMTPLLASMQDQIDTLKQELEDWKEEARRKDAILITMAQRIPELEAPSEAQESSEKGSEEIREGTTEQQEPTGRHERSWLHRFFFGP